MTKISKKAILSVLSLVLTFVALGATTFAWFSLGTTATVSPFDLEVKGSEGLEIQFGDDSSWYSTINKDLMISYIESLINEANPTQEEKETVYQDGRFVMNSVTTENGKNFFTYGITGNSMVHGSAQEAVANKDYLSLNFKLRTTAKQAINVTSLSVNDNGPQSNQTQLFWKADQNFTLAKGLAEITSPNSTLESHLTDALRVAFVVGETVVAFEKDATGATNTLGTLAKSDDNYIGAFEYYAKKSGYGNTDGTITLNPASGWTPLTTGSSNRFGNTVNAQLFAAPSTELGDTESYYYHDITVNIWFEGYDNEAFDYVLYQL